MPLSFALFLRHVARARQACSFAALAALVAFGPMASARSTEHHRHPHLAAMRHMLTNVGLPDMGIMSDAGDGVPEDGQRYEIRLARQSGEIIDVIYRVGDTYIPEALDKLSEFLRDSHNDEVKTYNPRTFDVLHTMLAKLNRPGNFIEVLCGYRTLETNEELRESGTTNAAKHSQHIEGNALDLRVPGIPAVQLRDAALSIGAGGVGYYPKGQFVHVDTGPVRKWTFSGRRRGKHTHRRHRA